MFQVGKGHLVFPAADPWTIRAVLPHAKTLDYKGVPHIAVPHELDAVTILRNMGIEAPSPVNYGWEYPGRYKPFEHQKATVEFLTLNRKAFVLSEMGSGKTAASAWAAEYLMQQGVLKRVLIVCPKSCMRKVWEDEIFQTLMHRTAVVLDGSRDRKRELFSSGAEFVIVNHDGVMAIDDLLVKDETVGLVIYDEASSIRNAQTNRYKRFKAALRPNMRLWLLTATPCPNAPTDAWALARLVRPELVDPYFTSFKRRTMIQVTNFKWVPKPESMKIAFDAMQPAIRFRTEDCIDLPPVTYQNRSCELSPEQKRLIKDMARVFVADKDGATITAANAAVKMVKLLQICGGAVYDDTGGTQVIDASDRLNTLKEIIEEADHKVIVWVPFKHVMEHLRQQLSQQWGTAVINGDVSANERASIITRFQDTSDPLKVLIAHPATAAHGLTLTAANICVWYGPTFSAEMKLQADHRIIRPGQKHHMSVIHLGASPIEWEAYNIANTKADRQGRVLALYTKILAGPDV